MTAIIQERGGFNIVQEVILLNGTIPSVNGTSPPSLHGLQYQNVTVTNPKTILVNVGDTVTIYVRSISTNETTVQLPSATGHGFELDPFNILDINIPWGNWHTMPTFTVTGQQEATFRCAQTCSMEHPSMTGTFSAGCGA
jgi:heme/copper-type cytochrome/quinol oxidase subunit 2